MAPKATNSQPHTELPRGAASYSGWRLTIYDVWVLGIVNTFAWRCSTTKHLLPLFRENIGASHIDLGVGTGYYVQHTDFPRGTTLTLCDLSPAALAAAKVRVQPHVDVGTLVADVLEPLPVKDRFDSASMFYLLHCLPGPMQRKVVVFDHIRRNLTANGVLTGATVLGPRAGWVDSWFGALIRHFVVRDGIMDNETDDPDTLIAALKDNFEVVEANVIGTVLIWKAQQPRTGKATL